MPPPPLPFGAADSALRRKNAQKKDDRDEVVGHIIKAHKTAIESLPPHEERMQRRWDRLVMVILQITNRPKYLLP